MRKIIADTHAHTIVSGHAYSTIREMAAAAKKKGIQIQALTEHAPKMPGTCGLYYFQNLDVIPREMDGVRMMFGAELNIMELDLAIASMHIPCFGEGRSEDEVMRAYEAVMKKPYVKIIGHPDDGRFPTNYEKLVKLAKETGTLLELNNSSLRPASFRVETRENLLTMLDLCKQYDVAVTTGSDAHVDVDAGNFCYVTELLEYCDFPEDLVATTDLNLLKEYLQID